MRRVVANALVTLLALLLSVGASRGEEIWVSCKVGTLEWSCQKIEGTETCKIKPANKADIQKEVTIPSEVTIDGKTLKVVTVAEEAFSDCADLSEVSIPEGVETIEKSAFSSCEKLPSLQLPQSLKVIGEQAFAWCDGLTSVIIPMNVESIGYDAFQSCSKLEKFEVAAGNGHFSAEGGVFFNNDKTALLCYPMGLSADSYDIPAGVKSIGACAFYGNGILKTVNIPAEVTAIGKHAFNGCSVLEKVVVPKGVTTIEENTFYSCEALSSVELPEGLKTIAGEAFSMCGALRSVQLPKGLTSIGASAFAFSPNFSEVTIPTSVTEIGDGAFSGTALTSVAIPAGVKGLGGVFSGCVNLEKVTLPEGLEGLDGTFFGCEKLTEITIPASVTEIGLFTFSNTALTSVAIPAGVKELPGAFTDCPNLEKVTLPEGLKVLEGTFSNCPKLTEITIPASVTTIGAETFKGCQNLATITIPASVKSIADNTFGECSALNKVYYLAAADATVADNAFEGIANPAILIVRREEKAAIEAKAWVKNGKFTVVADKNKVTFSTDGGLPVPDVQWVVYGKNAEKPAKDPVKQGFKFEGWTCNGEDYKFDIPVSEDIELKAKYVAEYTLTITSGMNGSVKVTRNDAQGDALTDGAKLKEGDKLFIAATPAEGYELETLTVNGNNQANSSVFTVAKANVAVAATFKAKGGATHPSAVESVLLAAARVVQNPIDNALLLEGISTAERIEVYSLTGVQTYACAPRGEERMEIATESWASGTYVVRIIAADGEKTVRVVKR